MNFLTSTACALFFTAAAATSAVAATAQEQITKNLTQRIPQLAHIDEVRPTPMAGLFEVRLGADIFYTDATGDFIIQGELIDTRAQRNLTEDRINQLTGIDFSKLPLKDAIKIVRGNGQRKMAIFEDPNCGYCKKLERDLQKLDNVTIYIFLYPILSQDSVKKSRNIWCSKDSADSWHQYMAQDKNIPEAAAGCDIAAIERNLAFGRQHKITGTPTILFTDNRRVPGAISLAQVEKFLQEAQTAAK